MPMMGRTCTPCDLSIDRRLGHYGNGALAVNKIRLDCNRLADCLDVHWLMETICCYISLVVYVCHVSLSNTNERYDHAQWSNEGGQGRAAAPRRRSKRDAK